MTIIVFIIRRDDRRKMIRLWVFKEARLGTLLGKMNFKATNKDNC